MARVALVTGGTRGIGKAIVQRLKEDGMLVAAGYSGNVEAAEATAKELGVSIVKGNVGSFDDCARAVKEIEDQLGPIDILVNNAGWDIFKPFTKTVPAEWDKLIAINLTGALHMHHAVLPGMVARGGGRVVNIASDAARGGSSGEAVYAACKGGLVALSKTLAREHARHNITVNVVCPGPTDTALLAGFAEGASNPEKLMDAFKKAIPLGRLGQPDDLAGAIVFLSSADSAFITGQVLSVSGGLTMHG